MDQETFDEPWAVRDIVLPRTAKKKRRPSFQMDEEDSAGSAGSTRCSPERRNLFGSNAPPQQHHDIKRTKQHSNVNPWAYQDAPSLLSNSTGDFSPEPMNQSSLTCPDTGSTWVAGPSHESPANQRQLCHDFRTTLSFAHGGEESFSSPDSSTLVPAFPKTLESPSTPPLSLANSPTRQFPLSVAKQRPQHRHQPPETTETSRFQKDFEVLDRLGGGDFGTVFKVRNRQNGILYAVKVVNQPYSGRLGRERVMKEAYALAMLMDRTDNSHILRYFSSWIDVDDKLYIQTELCDQSLEQLLKTRNHSQPPKDHELEEMACDILRQLLEGLKCLHAANVVHLDIKPANILVKNGTYKLGDYGHVAKARTETEDGSEMPIRDSNLDEEDVEQMRAANTVVLDPDEGDVRYMPRERLYPNREHLTKADIFSLAASIYEMFLQRSLPRNGDEWHALRDGQMSPEATKKMSPNFRQLMHLMMHPDPARRPSAEALVVTGGPGGILLPPERAKKQAELLRGLHPAHAVLKRANTM